MSTRAALYVCLCAVLGCEGPPGPPGTPPDGVLRLAVIGDFGSGDANEDAVASLVHRWQPDHVLTVGDNNYSSELGLMLNHDSYDRFVGSFYDDYISRDPARPNRFWPVLGNHDWYSPTGADPYLEYFPALPRTPADGRYYELLFNRVQLFVVDSDDHEPDGRDAHSRQAMWLNGRLAASSACVRLVFFHHAPYSSGLPGMYFVPEMRWPFAAWGADAVLSGHEHYYERSEVDGIPYFISGLGGYSMFPFLTNPPPPESRFRYNQKFGALFITVDKVRVLYEFHDVDGNTIDSLSVPHRCSS